MAALTGARQQDDMSKSQSVTLEGLPLELQKKIFKHCHLEDLIALALVSKHFHSVACAQLYRTFSIVFPDDDDAAYNSPNDGLAGGLDTMVMSEFDYAQHLKEITLDTLSGGLKGEKAYRAFSLEVSCGKFMSTLLVLCLRRARALETFQWNIRVEISRALFKALHELPSLTHLHIRLQPGTSIYQPPPPLKSSTSEDPDTTSPASASSSLSTKSIHASHKPKAGKSEPSLANTEGPPTFSGFKSLSSLAVLDMDNYDYLSEITACVEASASTLRTLKLSISERMARTARRPIAEDTDDSDQDMVDDDDFIPPVESGVHVAHAPTTPEVPSDPDLKFRLARQAQETILEKILGMEKASVEKSKRGVKSRLSESTEKPKPTGQETQFLLSKLVLQNFDRSLRSPNCGKDLLERLKEIGEFAGKVIAAPSEDERRAIVEEYAEISQLPLGDIWPVSLAVGGLNSTPTNQIPHDKDPEDSTAKKDAQKSEKTSPESDSASKSSPQTVFPAADPSKVVKDPISDQIDVEHPDIVEEGESDHEEGAAAAETANARVASGLGEDPKKEQVNGQVTMSGGLNHDDIHSNAEDVAEDATSMLKAVNLKDQTDEKDEVKLKPLTTDPTDGVRRDYIRSTRKYSLESLSLHLIPLRISVVFNAIDVTSLKNITLLNVGAQGPFWAMLSKTGPLNLEKIYTDHVTSTLLALLKRLDNLRELFLLERKSGRNEIESTAPKTTMTISHIRVAVLKKHIATLERLIIRNDNDASWDIDPKTIRLIASRGEKLRELAMNISLTHYHLFLQLLPALTTLKAIHIVNFRSEDSCPTLKRDLLRFTSDVVAHHPQMALEYVALDQYLQQFVREVPGKPKKQKTSTKRLRSKPLQPPLPGNSALHDSIADDLFLSNGSSSEEEPEVITTTANAWALPPSPYLPVPAHSHGPPSTTKVRRKYLKLSVLEDVRFYDVSDVKIYRKDIRSGTL